jgi:hypothetical protein
VWRVVVCVALPGEARGFRYKFAYSLKFPSLHRKDMDAISAILEKRVLGFSATGTLVLATFVEHSHLAHNSISLVLCTATISVLDTSNSTFEYIELT